MKRHPALQDLSRDHHTVLWFCQRMRRAVAARAPESGVTDLGKEFVGYFTSDMAAHFQEEDGFVGTLALTVGSKELAAVAKELQQDHVWLRETIGRLAQHVARGLPILPILAELEPRLTDHVRAEESKLFQGAQEELTEETLEAMWKGSYAFRSKHRSKDACTVKPRQKTKRS